MPYSGLIPMLERRKKIDDLINYITDLLLELGELEVNKQTWLLVAQMKHELEEMRSGLNEKKEA